jgi:hypothetical protein
MAVAFSSSSTDYNITDQSSSNSQATTIGDLSSDNKITYGDYVEQGLVGENLSTVLDAITGTTDQAITSAHLTAEQAIKATGEAYAESKSELRNFIDAVRPIALYAAIAAVFYYIFAKGK